MIEDDDVPVTGIGLMEDSWYLCCSKLDEDRPKTFSDWKVENVMFYRQKPNPVTLMPDLKACE